MKQKANRTWCHPLNTGIDRNILSPRSIITVAIFFESFGEWRPVNFRLNRCVNQEVWYRNEEKTPECDIVDAEIFQAYDPTGHLYKLTFSHDYDGGCTVANIRRTK